MKQAHVIHENLLVWESSKQQRTNEANYSLPAFDYIWKQETKEEVTLPFYKIKERNLMSIFGDKPQYICAYSVFLGSKCLKANTIKYGKYFVLINFFMIVTVNLVSVKEKLPSETIWCSFRNKSRGNMVQAFDFLKWITSKAALYFYSI